jgi:hypothetical protein
VESGAVTSIAISADHTTVAGGYANGSIFTWETARAAKPFLHIPHLDASQLQNRTMDGHMPGVTITHLGFLGTRHTALVSADDRGMAFSHLATRGLGAVGRTVKTTRILGRYPNDTVVTGKPRKPSTVLAFAPLPLGNVERPSDILGLTAMLTPYLLVIVSTTPIAQTQHKAARPKEVAAHGAMSGCLAWFPAVKLKVKDPDTGLLVSRIKLVYCWSNVLTVMDIDEIESPDKDKPPTLSFQPRNRWKSEEAIVAVQWLSRSVLTVLTITQRLIILEEKTMRMTEAFDLIHKHIYHQDLFSSQLHNLVERLDEEDPSMHGVVADAFYMSFKAYKGRMFLLGFNDISMGTLSNWADRLIALMESGDYVGAIQLATSYYTGDAEKLTVGLPEDSTLRHSTVREKVLEIMSASLKFAFKRDRSGDPEPENELKQLVEACFIACLSIDDVDFIFEEVYEWYEDGDVEGIFLETLEPYILERQISTVPPVVVKAMVTHYVTKGLESRLEEILCHMDTMTLDIDQVTILCKQHNLYDALIYVWNQALADYITPLIDLLTLLVPLVQGSEHVSDGELMNDPIYGVNALKIFPYLSYTFTGRIYPTGEDLDGTAASKAKAELYWFLFSGMTISWPRGSGKPFLTQSGQEDEPSFPYLRMILKFDAPSFLSAMNEAFEDSFLNDSPDRAVDGGSKGDMPEEQVFGLSVNRQYVVSILLEVMNPTDFAPEDTIYLDMFIARNLPKFPQYLLLSGTSLHKILVGLCNYPGNDLADDAELSAEYLLSVYHPPDLTSLIPEFRRAHFYRVLKSIYKAEKQYAKLVEVYFEDEDDQASVFDCIADCLRPRAGLSKRHIQDVYGVIKSHAQELVRLDASRAARVIDLHASALHEPILDALEDDSYEQYVYLKTILEPETPVEETKASLQAFIETYVKLMCKHDSEHVADYISRINASDLRLESVLPAMEESGIINAAVVLLAREGQIRQAMDRLLRHLETLRAALAGLLTASNDDDDQNSTEAAAEELLGSLAKYTDVGIWLCQGQSKASVRRSSSTPKRKSIIKTSELSPDESLWLDLIDTNVQITKSISEIFSSKEEEFSKTAEPSFSPAKLRNILRTLVQRTFTALLTTTSTANPTISFLNILRTFLTRASASSPNLSDLRSVLSDVFSAYTYETSILSLANRLIDKDLYGNVQEAAERRGRGWRPRGTKCEGCGRRVWGAGAEGDVWGKWEAKQIEDGMKRKAKMDKLQGNGDERGKGRLVQKRVESKSRSRERPNGNSNAGEAHTLGDEAVEADASVVAQDLEPLVVLACRHLYHQRCLEGLQAEEDTGSALMHDGREFKCPIDG